MIILFVVFQSDVNGFACACVRSCVMCVRMGVSECVSVCSCVSALVNGTHKAELQYFSRTRRPCYEIIA